MRLLAWNIRHGGGNRIDGIRDALQQHAADVVVLCEYRGGESGTRLKNALEHLGYRHQTTPEPPKGRNGVLVAAKGDFFERGTLSDHVPEPHRMVNVEFSSFQLVGVYLPNLAKKIPYWDEIVATSTGLAEGSAIVLGDFNTTRHYLDEAANLCVTSGYMDAMESIGFSDVWRRRYPDRREYSWFSNRGNGFRIDHAFFTQKLASRVKTIRYSHDERQAGFSDHSLLIVDLALPRLRSLARKPRRTPAKRMSITNSIYSP